MNNKFVIFDIDNCIADDAWRIPLVDWSAADPGKRYEIYHRACGGDEAGNVDILFKHVSAGEDLFFLTGRPNAVRAQTTPWIESLLAQIVSSLGSAHLPRWHLLMRNDGDERPSVDIKRDQLRSLVADWEVSLADCTAAYDDRSDIVEMYMQAGLHGRVLCVHNVDAYNKPSPTIAQQRAPTAADAMTAGAALFAERNGVYQDNYLRVGPIMAALFPEGAPPSVLHNPSFHLLELIVVKLTRFAISGLAHKDSIEDTMVYAAMIAANIQRGLSAASKEKPQ